MEKMRAHPHANDNIYLKRKKEPGLAKKNKPRDIRTAMRRRIK